MLLKKLINNLPPNKKNIKINGLSINSKKVKKGFIFFAIKGKKLNGEKFINEAINRGAKIVICSKNCNFVNKNILIIKTNDVKLLLSDISSKFYNLKPKNIIAVTGTNGKTSVADLFYQILSANNIPVASIGTLGIKYKKKKLQSHLTSPDAITLHQALQHIKINKIDNVIIEASSHGLHQKRIENLNFKAGIFTNFSQDHLDYHKTMHSYLNAKLHLFKNLLNEKKVIISDKSLKEFKILKNIAQKKNLRLIDITQIKKKIKLISGIKLSKFQLNNLSMAIAAARLCNVKEKKIFYNLNKLSAVDGRLEHVKTFFYNIKIFVDFAHTPDALQNVLSALKSSYGENITLVFGCGGDRDFKKRPKMAKIANKHCKKIYVTDDNPRNERPEKIRGEIVKHIKKSNCFNIGNRTKAIKSAILNAEPNEVIIIAGKGHESEQIYKNKTYLISDKEIVRKLKIKKKRITIDKINFEQNEKIIQDIVKKNNLKKFHGISIDSRNVKKNNLFLTIKGKNNDGAKFIPKALKNGARYIVSSRKIKKFKNVTIKVDDESFFLRNYASKKREKTSAKIIAVTGSAGKTSLKDLLKNLLKNFGDTLSSPKSYNNHFGVPISLSQLRVNHNYGVFEVGMSKKGEINTLTKIIKPHIGIITNVGEAHIENFKNLKGIADAKGEIINNIIKGGTLILNRDDKYFTYLKRKAELRKIKIISFGLKKNSDIQLISKSKDRKHLIVKVKNETCKIKIKNINIYNVLASLAVLNELNLNFKEIINKYKNSEPTEGRGRIYNITKYKKKFKLVDESYNANPLSVKNAIKNLNSIKKQNFKKYLILGDMLELGRKSEFLHKDLSKVINNSDIDKVFIKGNKTLATYRDIDKSKRGNILQHEEDVDFILNNIISNNDYLMIKGSNATGLNILSKKIIKG